MALFGRKSDHPMAGLKSAQEVLAEIPKNDALKALQELTGWIESMRNVSEIRLDNRFAVLRLLDETARPYETKVTRDYFSAANMAAFHENRLWTTLNGFFSQMAEAYYDVLVGCRNGEKGASALKESRILLAARGIHAAMGRLKCAAVRYTPVDPSIWEQLAEYYIHAETQRYLDEEFEFHSGRAANNSVRRRIAGALLWWGSGTGSLKPLQIHLSERLTAHLSPALYMGIEPEADSLFSFDLAQPRAPVRYSGDTAVHPNLRFVRLSRVQGQLEHLVGMLGKGTVPGEIDLGGRYEAEAVLEAAKRLASSWLSAPPTRRTKRRSINVPMNVVGGFAGLVDQAHQHSAAGDEEAGEKWEADDISATGFRCSVPVARSGWIKVGSLIGFKPENVKYWGAGIVRRLRRDEQNYLDIGIEVLANRVSGVMLREEGSSDDRPVVWLVKPGTDEGEARLLVKPGSFADNRTLQGRMEGKRVLLMPQKRDEKGDDYDLMHYRKVEQEMATEEAV
jgi:hypothetical protein